MELKFNTQHHIIREIIAIEKIKNRRRNTLENNKKIVINYSKING